MRAVDSPGLTWTRSNSFDVVRFCSAPPDFIRAHLVSVGLILFQFILFDLM